MSRHFNSYEEPQILKICYGNDFGLSVSVNTWNAETGAWDKLDLSAAKDIELFLVSQNGKRIKTTSQLDENGDITTTIPASYLSKTIYSIEITFRLDERNRRTYSPCMIQIVNSTDDAGKSVADYVTNDAYHFDILVKNDVAWLNVGSLPSEYVTEDELADELSYYVSKDYLSQQSYVTKQYLSQQSYVTTQSLSQMGYITLEDIPEVDLSSYVTYSYLDERLENIDLPTNVVTSYDGTYIYCLTQEQYDNITPDPNIFYYITDSSTNYVTRAELSSYATKQYLSQQSYVTANALTNAGYVTSQSLSQMGYITLEDIPEVDLSSYVSKDYLSQQSYVTANALINAGYVTVASLSQMGYITLEDIPEVDLSSYVKKTELDDTLTSYVTFSDVNDMSYVTYSYLSDNYITYSYLSDNYITYAYLDERLADLPGGDVDLSSYVTYTYWDSSNEAIAYFINDQYNFNNYVKDSFYEKNDINMILTSYATKQFVRNELRSFITINDNEQQNAAIAYAISYLNDLISQINNS